MCASSGGGGGEETNLEKKGWRSQSRRMWAVSRGGIVTPRAATVGCTVFATRSTYAGSASPRLSKFSVPPVPVPAAGAPSTDAVSRSRNDWARTRSASGARHCSDAIMSSRIRVRVVPNASSRSNTARNAARSRTSGSTNRYSPSSPSLLHPLLLPLLLLLFSAVSSVIGERTQQKQNEHKKKKKKNQKRGRMRREGSRSQSLKK